MYNKLGVVHLSQNFLTLEFIFFSFWRKCNGRHPLGNCRGKMTEFPAESKYFSIVTDLNDRKNIIFTEVITRLSLGLPNTEKYF